MQPQNPADSVEKRPLAPVYQLDDLIVDTGRISVTRDGLELPLPKLSFDLLVALIKAAPSVVSQEELMDRSLAGTRRRPGNREPAHQAAAGQPR